MVSLRSFVEQEESTQMWETLKEQAALDGGQYSLVEKYPKEEFLEFSRVLVEEYGRDRETLQREFGRYLFSEVAEVYEQAFFRKEWDALDMIDNIEKQIHSRLKAREDDDFIPPKLETELIDEETIVVRYDSESGFCQIATGIIRGISEYYDTQLLIDEPLCLKDGDEVCRLVVSRID